MKSYRARFIAPIAIASAAALGGVAMPAASTRAADLAVYGPKVYGTKTKMVYGTKKKAKKKMVYGTKKKEPYGAKKSKEKMKAAPYGAEKKK